jgi:hypothetical protein
MEFHLETPPGALNMPMNRTTASRRRCFAMAARVFERSAVPPVLLVTGLAMWALAACGGVRTYPGPERPRKDVAVIHGSRAVGGLRVYFTTVDKNGEEVATYTIEVPAGRQRVTFTVASAEGSVMPVVRTVAFIAKGGHTYRAQGSEHADRVWLWVEDAQTHEVVGGEEP